MDHLPSESFTNTELYYIATIAFKIGTDLKTRYHTLIEACFHHGYSATVIVTFYLKILKKEHCLLSLSRNSDFISYNPDFIYHSSAFYLNSEFVHVSLRKEAVTVRYKLGILRKNFRIVRGRLTIDRLQRSWLTGDLTNHNAESTILPNKQIAIRQESGLTSVD